MNYPSKFKDIIVLQYVFTSKNGGVVSFLQIWNVNQNITSGEVLFSVVPQFAINFIGNIKAPSHNSGKIKIGQNVNIRLTNYLDKEFGVLKGKIKNISLVPDKDGNLLANVVLVNGLTSTYKKQIPFQQEMSGNAEIITHDLRLIERFFNPLKEMIYQN